MLRTFVIYLSVFVVNTSATCPPSEIRVQGELHLRCATAFEGRQCRGPARVLYNPETNVDLERGWDNRISAVVINGGCELTVWLRPHFQGETISFPAGVYWDLHLFTWRCFANGRCANWGDAITSYRCICLAG